MDLMIIALVAVGAIVLIPVLVVGNWGLIVYGIVGAVDGAVWLLDRRWRHPQSPADASTMEHPRETPVAASRPLNILSISLFAAITLTALVVVPGYGYLVGYTSFDWLLFGVLYIVTGLGITVGYHRLIAHRSFTCRNWVKVVLLVAGAWALQNSALKWATDHRRHHAECDDDGDPYNAQEGFWYSHCGWLFFEDAPERNAKYENPLRADPLVAGQDRYYPAIMLSGLALPAALGFTMHGWRGAMGCFLLAGVGRLFCVLNSTFCINSICHLWGSQPHGHADSSRDSWWVSFLTFGEGYHNYHHTHQSDYRNGPAWHNFDPSKWLICALSWVGLASSLRRSPPSLAAGR